MDVNMGGKLMWVFLRKYIINSNDVPESIVEGNQRFYRILHFDRISIILLLRVTGIYVILHQWDHIFINNAKKIFKILLKFINRENFFNDFLHNGEIGFLVSFYQQKHFWDVHYPLIINDLPLSFLAFECYSMVNEENYSR